MSYEENNTNTTTRIVEHHPSTNSILLPLTIAACVVALAVMAFVQVNMHHDQQRTNDLIASMAEKQAAKFDALESRAATLEQDTSTLHAQGTTYGSALKDTHRRLVLTRTATEKKLAQEIGKEHEMTAQQIGQLATDQEAKLGSINGEVVAVKGNLTETKANLDGVSSKLDHTIGDLGVQSGLVARNHDELADLRRKGERDYTEFDLKKGKDFTRVSDLSMRLMRTDAGNQKYTVSLLVADKKLEKKDKTALEPVQLYMPGGHKLVEIVVWDVNKDRVVGYVSAPKL